MFNGRDVRVGKFQKVEYKSNDMDKKRTLICSVRLLYVKDAAANESWSNTIPIDAPSLLSSCRRLSQSCSHLTVNNSSGLCCFY